MEKLIAVTAAILVFAAFCAGYKRFFDRFKSHIDSMTDSEREQWKELHREMD